MNAYRVNFMNLLRMVMTTKGFAADMLQLLILNDKMIHYQ